MDILIVGMNGQGMNPEVSMGGCTKEEYQTHFALWAMMSSPLMIGCDIRTMSDEAKKILTNPDLIAINQDREVRSCVKISPAFGNADTFVLVKPLSPGDYAIGFFNFNDVPAKIALDFWDMGLAFTSGLALHFYDCLTHQALGPQWEIFAPTVPAHGCAVYRCTVTV